MSSSYKIPTSKNLSSDNALYNEAQFNAINQIVESNKSTILHQAIDSLPDALLKAYSKIMHQKQALLLETVLVFPDELVDAYSNALLKLENHQIRVFLLCAIKIFPNEFMCELMITNEDWIKKFISTSFKLDLCKQTAHEICVLENAIKKGAISHPIDRSAKEDGMN
jgi:hypothetical protein